MEHKAVSLPQHVAMIMDGNGRWAKNNFLARVFGHRAGVETVRKIIRYVSDLGIAYLTLYAFSTENWARPSSEVKFLMNLFKKFIKKEKKYLNENNVKVKFIGIRSALPPELVALMFDIEDFTKDNSGLTLILAINYGGRLEIAQSVQSLLHQAVDYKEFTLEQIEVKLSENLEAGIFPPPDLLIRTAGERRISNFLLWHIAYSEFYFSDKLWPEFDLDDMKQALDDYAMRERRFGALHG